MLHMRATESERETEERKRERGPPDKTGEGREERDDVKRGKFWPRAPPSPPPNGMDLALTKDDQGERERGKEREWRGEIFPHKNRLEYD